MMTSPGRVLAEEPRLQEEQRVDTNSPFAQLAIQLIPGLDNEAKQGVVAGLPPLVGIVPHSGTSSRQGGRWAHESRCPAPCNDSPAKRVLCSSWAVYSVRHCPRRAEEKRDSDACGCENTRQEDDPDDDNDRDFHFVCRRSLWDVLTHRFPLRKQNYSGFSRPTTP